MMPRRALKLGQKNIFAKNSVCFLFRRFASKQTPKDDIKNAPKVEKNFENLAKRTDNVQKTAETIKKDGENESYIPIKEPEDGTGNYAYWAKGENLKKEGTTKVIRNAGFYFMLAVIVYYTISKVNEKKKFTAISNAEVMVCQAKKGELDALAKLRKANEENIYLMNEIKNLSMKLSALENKDGE